jgi:hypothetical protein
LAVLPLCLALGTVAKPIPPGELTLHTDRPSYVALPALNEPPYLYTFTLVGRLDNTMGRPVHLNRSCRGEPMPQYGVRAAEEGLESAYDPLWICAELRPTPVIVVQPGETRVDTLHIEGPSTWNGRTKQPYGVLAGRFRLVYEVNGCEGPRDCAVRSNEFEVRLGR